MNNEIPEYEFFERLEKTEQDIGELKPTVVDGVKVALEACFLAFLAMARLYPSGARKIKDLVIADLKGKGLAPPLLEMLEHDLLLVCDRAEK